MKKYLLEKFEDILRSEKGITEVSIFCNILNEWCISFWYKDVEYLISIEEIFKKSEV